MSIDKLTSNSEYLKYSLGQSKIKDFGDTTLLSFNSNNNFTNPSGVDTVSFSSNSTTNADVAAQLKAELNKTKGEQGLIGKAWDGVKNLFGMKAGSNNVEKAIEQLEKGEITQEEAQEVLTKYQDGQKMCVDVVGDMVSGIVAVGCAVAAPLTGGASLLVAAGAGAAVKVAIKGADCAVGGRDYKLKDFGYDLITGSINGAMAPITNALGGVVGTGVAKVCGLNAGKVIVKETGEKVIEESVKQAGKSFLSNLLAKQGTEYIAKEGAKVGLKTTLATIAAYGADMAVDGALGGATDGFARSLAEGDFENMGENVTQGFVGGLIAAPVIGGGFRLAGKAGSKVGSKLFGNATANTVSSNAGDLTSGITGATAVSGLTIATRELSENVAVGLSDSTTKEISDGVVDVAADSTGNAVKGASENIAKTSAKENIFTSESNATKTIANADGKTIKLEYDENGQLKSSTIKYDKRNKLIKEYKDGRVTCAYKINGVTPIDVSEYTYNEYGKIANIEKALSGDNIEFCYNSEGKYSGMHLYKADGTMEIFDKNGKSIEIITDFSDEIQKAINELDIPIDIPEIKGKKVVRKIKLTNRNTFEEIEAYITRSRDSEGIYYQMYTKNGENLGYMIVHDDIEFVYGINASNSYQNADCTEIYKLQTNNLGEQASPYRGMGTEFVKQAIIDSFESGHGGRIQLEAANFCGGSSRAEAFYSRIGMSIGGTSANNNYILPEHSIAKLLKRR